MKLKLAYSLLPIIVLVGGCDQSNTQNLDADNSDGSVVDQSTVAESAVAESIVGAVNGKNISTESFEAFLKLKRVPADDGRRQALLEQYLEREALATVVEDEQFLDPVLVEVELNEFRKEMLISRYFEKFMEDKGEETAVRNFYESNAKDYELNKVKVAHILFRTNDQMDESELGVKLTSAREAVSKINAGSAFEEIAAEYSEDKLSANKGGDLGWIKEGSIDKRFSEKVFSMKKGDVSEPFITSFGYHIVKILDGPAITKQPFEAVKGKIRHQLRSQAKESELQRLLEKAEITHSGQG